MVSLSSIVNGCDCRSMVRATKSGSIIVDRGEVVPVYRLPEDLAVQSDADYILMGVNMGLYQDHLGKPDEPVPVLIVEEGDDVIALFEEIGPRDLGVDGGEGNPISRHRGVVLDRYRASACTYLVHCIELTTRHHV